MGCFSVKEGSLMHRFFAESVPDNQGHVILPPDESRHALTVLRMKSGDRAEVVCEGRPWLAEIVFADSKSVQLTIISELPSAEPSLSVTLFQGLPKSDKMDWIVQKATEIGVARIVPVLTERCVSRPEKKESGRKVERWQKIALEAAKQSGRSIIPEVSSPVLLQDLSSYPLPAVNIVPWEEASGNGPRGFHASNPDVSSLGILIGPEGGISPDEISFLKRIGFVPITLGRRILRTETAGLAAVSALFALYGEMEQA